MSPARRRASTAAIVKVDTARSASTRRCLQRLAGLGGDRPRQVVPPLRDELGRSVEDLGSAVGRERLGHCVRRGVDGTAGERGVGSGHAGYHVAGVGRAHLLPLARLEPGAVHEELLLGQGRRHDPRIRRRGGRTDCRRRGSRDDGRRDRAGVRPGRLPDDRGRGGRGALRAGARPDRSLSLARGREGTALGRGQECRARAPRGHNRPSRRLGSCEIVLEAIVEELEAKR